MFATCACETVAKPDATERSTVSGFRLGDPYQVRFSSLIHLLRLRRDERNRPKMHPVIFAVHSKCPRKPIFSVIKYSSLQDGRNLRIGRRKAEWPKLKVAQPSL